jgi:LuxR family maltose regulon positive regulatory protein
MPTPVLATKLFFPAPRPQITSRPRLLKRLNDELLAGRKLSLVCAPAGFGKTTLLSEWVIQRRRQHPGICIAWLSLDAHDNDPSRFLAYLVAALQGVDAEIGAEITDMGHSGQVLVTAPVLTSLINGIARSGKEFILVLDDYHVIEERPVHEALAFLLDHLPPQLHLAIATRSDPPLSLARLRSRGELTELRAADLRFTPDEAADFLNQVMNLGLSADDIAALATRTEGWIAGLQLAGLSLREHEDASASIRAFTGSHRFVIDYLVEEVLQRQPEEVRNFLVTTALLDHLTGGLCEALTGVGGGQAMLDALERDNLFVIPLDDRRQWYRYHHLFAEVLRARARQELPGRIPGLHRLASEWYEQNDLAEDAVHHALAAEDFERAANLIEAVLPQMRRTRQDGMMLAWLAALPDEVIRSRPLLSVFYAWRMLVSGDLDAVEPWLWAAEQGLEAAAEGPRDFAQTSIRGQELRMLPSTIAMYRASLAQARGDVSATAHHAREAFELAGPEDHFARGAAAAFLGLASWAQGDVETAVDTFSEAVLSLHEAGNLTDELSSTILLADMRVAAGQLQEARKLYERGLGRAAAQGGPVPRGTAELHVGYSELCREFGDLESAARHLQTSKELGRHVAPLTEHSYRWFVAMAAVREAEGDMAGAIESLDQAQLLYRRGFFPEIRPIPALKARVAIRVRPEEKTIQEAADLLVRLLKAAEAAGRKGSTYEILVLQALALDAQGQRALAMAPLERALAEAGPEGYVRLFLDEGAPFAPLLAAASKGTAAAHIAQLLQALKTAKPATAIRRAAAPRLEDLSKRELEVLRLLGSSLSGPEIARQLFVSVNTLRTHTKRIFTKLEVNSRREAVRHGKEQGLI